MSKARESIEAGLKLSLAWCDVNALVPPLDLLIECALEIKTIPFFTRALTRLVKTLYDGLIGGEFVETAKNLIGGQIRKAYEQAWKDEGNAMPLPEYLTNAAENKIAQQQSFVDNYYKDIIDARVEQKPIDPLLNRVDLWVNRYNEAYGEASHLMDVENGEKEIWEYGDTEHCPTCLALNGIVAYAKEWEIAGFHPQHAPNDLLDCGGWKCQCKRKRTDKRRTPNALSILLDMATARNIS